jgi:hypothetical protein
MTATDRTLPGTQHMRHLASSFNIFSLLLMSLGSAALLCAVLLASHFHVWGFSDEELAVMNELPESIVLLAVGMGGFCLFFPCFLALLFLRYLLSEVARLEAQIALLVQAFHSRDEPSHLDTDR